MGPSTPSMEGVAQAVDCAGKASRGAMQVVKHSVKSSFIFTHDRSERLASHRHPILCKVFLGLGDCMLAKVEDRCRQCRRSATLYQAGP